MQKVSRQMLVGVAGKARSGKDTIGNYLINQHQFVRYAFADPLKKACSEMFGVPLNYFYDDDKKEVDLPFWGMSPRKMAQLLGTEGGRELFGKDIWVKRALSFYNLELPEESNGMVITDVRFDNEADFIRDNGGLMIHVERPGADGVVGVVGHASEAGIMEKSEDIHIVNDGTLDQLYENVDVALAKLLIGMEILNLEVAG